MDDIKKKRSQREATNQALGIKVDVDFQAMVEESRDNVQFMSPVSKQDRAHPSPLPCAAHPRRPAQNQCHNEEAANLPVGTGEW